MKSTKKQLQSRGELNLEDLTLLEKCSKEQLVEYLYHEQPSLRTASIRLLSKYHNDDDYTQILLTTLKDGQPLYTRMEIQKQLTEYGDIALMCSYLGRIGHNQYTHVPQKISEKKSYPLPRDIIARSLAYVSSERFYIFFDILKQLPDFQLREGLDALGFFCFYHPMPINQPVYNFLKECLQRYSDDDLIVWKITTCLSALPQSIQLLQYIRTTYPHPTIIKEARRSLDLLIQKEVN